MTPPSAIETLTAAMGSDPAGREFFITMGSDPIVVVSWPAVPVEIVRAAGLRPLFIRGGPAATPAADAHLEADVFPSRLRHLTEAALTGRLSGAAAILLPRTSDPDYKCFLYLREFVRRGVVRTLPPTLLFDLLQSDGPDVRAYDAARARALFDALASLTGRLPSLDDLRREIARANAGRAALRRLLALRRETPRITGTDALPLLGAFWQMAPAEYAALAGEAAGIVAARPTLAGPRVLLAGAPVDGTALHAAVESHGAVVVAEPGPWGSGAAGGDVDDGGDPLTALADKYRADAVGPRTPAGVLRRWTERAVDAVDAVVVSLPPDDAVFGWDYPALRAHLESRRLPHVCLRGDPHRPLTPADRAQLDALVPAATRRVQEARHG